MSNDTPNIPSARNIVRNATLQLVDEAVQKIGPDPQEQIAILYLAHALATRRFLTAHNVTDRGRRMKVIRALVADFDSKLRQFARPDTDSGSAPESEMSPVFFAEKQGGN